MKESHQEKNEEVNLEPEVKIVEKVKVIEKTVVKEVVKEKTIFEKIGVPAGWVFLGSIATYFGPKVYRYVKEYAIA